MFSFWFYRSYINKELQLEDLTCIVESVKCGFMRVMVILFFVSSQESDESGSESVQSSVMEMHQGPLADMEEDTVEEAAATVVYDSPVGKEKQTLLCVLDGYKDRESIVHYCRIPPCGTTLLCTFICCVCAAHINRKYGQAIAR